MAAAPAAVLTTGRVGEELAAARLSPRSVSDLERGIHETSLLLAGALGLAEPVRSMFVAAARGRASASEADARSGAGIGRGGHQDTAAR
jgi:hypothetical protein